MLQSLAGAGITATDRKIGVRRAVEIAMLAEAALGNTSDPQQAAIHGLDTALAEVAKLQGSSTIPKVEPAKGWLRGTGEQGKEAAKLLDQMSRRRNSEAHPLLGKLMVMLNSMGASLSGVANEVSGMTKADAKGNIRLERYYKRVPGPAPWPASNSEEAGIDDGSGVARKQLCRHSSEPEKEPHASEVEGLPAKLTTA